MYTHTYNIYIYVYILEYSLLTESFDDLFGNTDIYILFRYVTMINSILSELMVIKAFVLLLYICIYIYICI